jgi:glycerophosphoryl diester phosphodiesterase
MLPAHLRRLYAHRGAPAECPENTLLSFQRAVAIGVDAIETDAHMTRDGHVIISHDPSAMRMTNHSVRWKDIDLAHAQQLDVGWGFVAADGTRPFSGQGARVVTLAELLATFPDMQFNVDLKQKSPSMVRATLDVIRKANAEHRVILASFHASTLLQVRRSGYGGETAMATAEVAAFAVLPLAIWRRLPFVASCAQVPLRAGRLRFDSRWFIDKCHAAGMRVDFWTINDPSEAKRLFAIGADGVMTDDPALLRAP